MQQRFGVLDADGDARISSDEYAQGARGFKLSLLITSDVFALVDANADGHLTREEFLALSDRWLGVLDDDHSGQVSLMELHRLYNDRDTPKGAREMLLRNDVNHDGHLDTREVERLLALRLLD